MPFEKKVKKINNYIAKSKPQYNPNTDGDKVCPLCVEQNEDIKFLFETKCSFHPSKTFRLRGNKFICLDLLNCKNKIYDKWVTYQTLKSRKNQVVNIPTTSMYKYNPSYPPHYSQTYPRFQNNTSHSVSQIIPTLQRPNTKFITTKDITNGSNNNNNNNKLTYPGMLDRVNNQAHGYVPVMTGTNNNGNNMISPSAFDHHHDNRIGSNSGVVKNRVINSSNVTHSSHLRKRSINELPQDYGVEENAKKRQRIFNLMGEMGQFEDELVLELNETKAGLNESRKTLNEANVKLKLYEQLVKEMKEKLKTSEELASTDNSNLQELVEKESLDNPSAVSKDNIVKQRSGDDDLQDNIKFLREKYELMCDENTKIRCFSTALMKDLKLRSKKAHKKVFENYSAIYDKKKKEEDPSVTEKFKTFKNSDRSSTTFDFLTDKFGALLFEDLLKDCEQ